MEKTSLTNSNPLFTARLLIHAHMKNLPREKSIKAVQFHDKLKAHWKKCPDCMKLKNYPLSAFQKIMANLYAYKAFTQREKLKTFHHALKEEFAIDIESTLPREAVHSGGTAATRISIAAVLRIRLNNKFLLINGDAWRPSVFGPIGGVFKYSLQALEFLDSLQFKPQELGPEMTMDLRGMLPAGNLQAFIHWFNRNESRESIDLCLSRELREELSNIGLSSMVVPSRLVFKPVRVVEEKPHPVHGRDYKQFRIIHVNELDLSVPQTKSFHGRLWISADRNRRLLPVTPDEIDCGSANDGSLISPVAEYLLRGQATRPDLPPLPVSYARRKAR